MKLGIVNAFEVVVIVAAVSVALLSVNSGLGIIKPAADLDVIDCDKGVSCSVRNYNENKRSLAHTIPKGSGGETVWDGTVASNGNIYLEFKHAGERNINGVWTIELTNKAGTVEYCVFNDIPHSFIENFNTIDLSGCSLAIQELNDLAIVFINGDTARSQDAHINYANIVVK